MLQLRRLAILFIAAALVALPIASVISPVKAQDGTSINILMETVPDTDFVQELLPQFEEETGIDVNIEVLTYVAIHERLIPQFLASEGAYDVVVVDKQWVGEFVGADWLMPLDECIEEKSFDTSAYVPAMFEMLGEVNDTTYMLPFYNYTMGLVYRTDLFEDPELQAEFEAEFGRPLEVPQSVPELVEVAQFLTRDTDGDGTVDLYGITQQLARGVGIHAEWANLFFSLGGWYYDDEWNAAVNTEEGVQALESLIELYQTSAPEGATGYNFDEQAEVMRQGQAAMMLTYSWMLAALNDPEQKKNQRK